MYKNLIFNKHIKSSPRGHRVVHMCAGYPRRTVFKGAGYPRRTVFKGAGYPRPAQCAVKNYNSISFPNKNILFKKRFFSSVTRKEMIQLRVITSNLNNSNDEKYRRLDIQYEFAERYDLLENMIIPFEYYLWLIEKQIKEKKYLILYVNNLNKKYLIDKKYAKKINIIKNCEIEYKLFDKIPKKYLKHEKINYVIVNVSIPGNKTVCRLILPKKYCINENILDHTYLSWDSYKNHRKKIIIQNNIFTNEHLKEYFLS